MKFVNRLMLAFICLFLSIHQANPKIQDIRTMAGWYDCFQDESKHLSPFNGFVWWETKFIEKMFRFGHVQTQTKKRSNGGTWTEAISGDATIKLLYQLFQDIEGTLHLVQEPTHFAYYLTPELIGKILHLLKNPAPTISRSKKFVGLSNTISGKTVTDKIEALQNDPKYQNQSQTLYTNLLQDLFKMHLESSLDTSVGKSTKREIIKSANKFADLFTKALSESHDLPSIEEQKFIAHTPGYILVSFMYAKVDNADQFRKYIAQLPPSVLREQAEEILNTKKFDNSWTAEQFDKSDKQFIQEHHEEICFTNINDQFYKLQTPPLKFNRIEVNIDGFEFTSCVEEAMYNFILLIFSKIGLYNPINKVFELNNLEITMTSWLDKKKYAYDREKLKCKLCDLRNFLEEFNNSSLMHSKKCLQAWTEFVSDRDGIKYSRCIDKFGCELEKKNRNKPFIYSTIAEKGSDSKNFYREKTRNSSFKLCELAGHPSTFVNIINDTLGLSCLNFPEVCNLFDFIMEQSYLLKESNNEPALFEDLSIINNNSLLSLNLKVSITQQINTINILGSSAHAAVSNEIDSHNIAIINTSKVMNYFLNNLIEDNDSLKAQLLMLYSTSDVINSHSALSHSPSYLHHHLWFIRNLFDKDIRKRALAKLASSSNTLFLSQLTEKQFSLCNQPQDTKLGELLGHIIYEKLKNHHWVIQLCKTIEDYHLPHDGLWQHLLSYLAIFHNQFDQENETHKTIAEYLKKFSQAEIADQKIKHLIDSILRLQNMKNRKKFNLLVELTKYLFQESQHHQIFCTIAQQFLSRLNEKNQEIRVILKILIEEKLKNIFSQPLPIDDELQRSAIKAELNIFKTAEVLITELYLNEDIELVDECLTLIFERVNSLLRNNDPIFNRMGIWLLWQICESFHKKNTHTKIQEIFDAECLPLINYLNENRDSFIQTIGEDSFNLYIGWLLYYRNEFLTAS